MSCKLVAASSKAYIVFVPNHYTTLPIHQSTSQLPSGVAFFFLPFLASPFRVVFFELPDISLLYQNLLSIMLTRYLPYLKNWLALEENPPACYPASRVSFDLSDKSGRSKETLLAG